MTLPTFADLCRCASTCGGPTFHPIADDLAAYRDEGAGAWFVADVDDIRAFIDLAEGDDDAYSHWCSEVSAVECPAHLVPGR